MIRSWFQQTSIAATILALSVSAPAQQADFNEVGKRMVILLQNTHFARPEFNAELSKRFLDDYLKDLDPQRLYFTQQDVDRFTTDYGNRLHTMLFKGSFMTAATDIYQTFKTRVKARLSQTEMLLKGPDFDFTANDSVMLSRKDAPWPKDEADASELWSREIKEAVLAETLHRETIARLAKEQGKTATADESSAKVKVALRYKRFLAGVTEVDDEEISNHFLNSVARSYDPHTDYMSFREMDRFKDDMKNELVGVGAVLQGEDDGSAKIMAIVIGGPADREGALKLNDRIVAVDSLNTGKPTDMIDIMFMRIDKVVELIRGKEGTSVALKVEPSGGTPGESKTIVIKRGKVEMKDEQASGEIIEMKNEGNTTRKLGAITLPSFYSDFEESEKSSVRCSVDVERILKRLVAEKIDGLILDLRNNGGGSLEEVRLMTGLFIDRGPVVQIKDSEGRVQFLESERKKALYGGPMVVLTDKGSASASEILAGALQDYNRAVVIGESSTFGKGTVQTPMDVSQTMPPNSAKSRAGFLKATIQKFYRPSGSSTQMDGVKSDIVLPSLMDSLDVGEAFLDHPLPHDRIRKAPDFKPLDATKLFLPRLKELSQERVNANKDFAYVIQDVMKTTERIKTNASTLNKAASEKELIDSDAQQKERNAERRIRFGQMSKDDKANLSFYKLTLDDLDKHGDLKPYDPSDETGGYMRKAKEDNADLDDTPNWPTGLDPVKRESLSVLRDLVNLTQNSRIAGLNH